MKKTAYRVLAAISCGVLKSIVNAANPILFAPNLGGFRFNPFFTYTIGLLSNENNNLYKGKAYSQIGIGVIISNDFLVFNSFQFSFSYYPSVPIDGSGNMQTNSFKTTDFGMPNFEFGKPQTVPYD
ncbi:hypothetical protein H9W95_11645 [Flavobacterium lindanitolerans]|nr:hypothetical protein [Flavobacterium lindanitolerans]